MNREKQKKIELEAKRYRWLRRDRPSSDGGCPPFGVIDTIFIGSGEDCARGIDTEKLDAAIDLAMDLEDFEE